MDLETKYSCVHTLIAEQAHRSPDAPALCSASCKITYRQLEASSTRLSQRLSSAGVVAGVLVPFCFEKSILATVAMLAILKAGGACVALDPAYPHQRIHSIVKATSAKVVLTSATHAQIFEDITTTTLVVLPEILADALNNNSLYCPSTPDSPDAPAFVMFTSGSSGQPKGVVLQHAAVCTSAHYHGPAMYVDASTRVFQYAPYTFDMSIYDIFTTLIYGGCVCVPSDEDRVHNITDAMREMNVNWAFLPPSLVSLLDPSEVPGLKTLQLAAEPASPSVIKTWGDKVRLINGYGSTECSTCFISTLASVDPPNFIGFPYGVSAWIVDASDHNNLLPFDSVGELVVAGPVISQGYLGDEGLTREKFLERVDWLPREYLQKGFKLYKTGDLARQSQDGSFMLVGRKGNMVKVRGQRVELGEVEKQLSMCQDVKLCIVAFPKEGLYRDCLTAVYQPKLLERSLSGVAGKEIEVIDQQKLKAAGIQWRNLARFLAGSLPKYMVPQHWFAVRALPLLSSGKRDRLQINSWLAALRPSQPIANLSSCGFHSGQQGKFKELPVLQVITCLLRELTHGAFPLSDADNEVPLAEAGFDSIRQIAMNRKVKTIFQVSIDLPILSKLNAIGISKFITDIQAGKSSLAQAQRVNPLDEYYRFRLELQRAFPASRRRVNHIFLTGASGFLGIHILKELLHAAPNTVIICLTRAQSEEAGIQRLSNSAETANWSISPFYDRIRVWTGDLSLPRLGLATSQWDCLIGNAPRHELIDAVIHNGAAVHWTKDYSTLSAPNVHSTMAILQAISQSVNKPSVIYVSGGRAWKATEGNELDVLGGLGGTESLCGYDLSKLLSELLVKEFSRLSKAHSVSIVRPGYIIGTANDGIANTDDFIWRLVAANIDLKLYNSDEADSWLYISGADRVAEVVVGQLVQPGDVGTCTVTNVTDGLTMQEFWDIFTNEMNFEMSAVSGSAWLERVHAVAGSKGESYPLWPLLDVLIQMDGRAGVQRAEKTIPSLVSKNVRATIVRNIEFLRCVGFLPDGCRQVDLVPKAKGFSRNAG